MKNILIFLSLIFATKLVEDNLPNLHHKNIGKAFNKYAAPALLMGYIGLLFLLTKISRNKELHKNYLQALVVVTIALVAGAVLSKHKKDVSL